MDVLKNPNKYYWVTLFGSANIIAPVLTLFYLSRGLTYPQLFTLYSIVVISMFIFEVPTGYIGDKYGRKTSIIIGRIGWLIFGIGFIFANSFLAFAILFVLWGFNVTCASGSDEAMIYDSLKLHGKENEMQKWMGRLMSARFLPGIILAPIGAIIAHDLTHFQFIFLLSINVLFVLISLIISFTLVEPKQHSGPHEIRSPWSHFKESLSHIKKSPILLKLFFNKTLILIPASHIFGLLWQPYLKDVSVPIAYFGILTTVSGIIIYFSSKHIDYIEKKISNSKIILYTSILPFLAFVIGAYSSNIVAAICVYLAISTMVWIRDPIFSQQLNKHIDSHNRATVLSTLSMIDSLCDIIVFMSAGFLTSISISYSFMFSAVLILIAMVFFRHSNVVD